MTGGRVPTRVSVCYMMTHVFPGTHRERDACHKTVQVRQENAESETASSRWKLLEIIKEVALRQHPGQEGLATGKL